MFEHRNHRLISKAAFRRRIIRHVLLALAALAVALGIGVLGYHVLEGIDWIDSLLNASMILGGMGPVDQLKNTSAKIFASFYALFSGLVFIAIASFLVAPFAHRLLHHFHAVDDKD